MRTALRDLIPAIGIIAGLSCVGECGLHCGCDENINYGNRERDARK